jgi:hypothetical protein
MTTASTNGTSKRPRASVLEGMEGSVFKAILGFRRGAGSIGRSTDIAKVKVALPKASKGVKFRTMA